MEKESFGQDVKDNDFYRYMFESIRDPILVIRKDGRIIEANKAIIEATGYSKNEMLHMNILDLRPTFEKHKVKEHIEKSRKGCAFETYYQRKDGSVFPVEISAAGAMLGEELALFGVIRDITERKLAEERLKRIEWLLTKSIKHDTIDSENPPVCAYGDLTSLNHNGLILRSVGKNVLKEIVKDYLSLLDTSAAVYEKNGDYAYGIFSSGWCRLMDASSRSLCNTDDNAKALCSGKWLCHESCWMHNARIAIETGQPADITCAGGIHLYAVPIFASSEVIGAINFGYGDPPKDYETLEALASKFCVSMEQLRKQAESYESRPPYIIELAKQRLETSAKLTGTIVERKQAEEEARSAQNMLQLIMNNIPQGIFWKDRNSTYMGCNKVFADAAGIESPEDIEGKTDYDMPWSSQQAEQFREYDRDIIQNDEPVHHIVEQQREADGRLAWVETSKVPLHDTNGNVMGILGTYENITERKRVEKELFETGERLRTLADNISQFAWMADEKGWIFWYNKRWFDYTGTTLEEMEGWGWQKVHHPDHVQRVVEKISHCFKTGEFWEDTFPLKGKDGQYRWFLSRAIPIKDEQGNVLRWFGTNTDITQLRETEEKLRESKAQAELYVDLMGHDINNMNHSAIGYLELALETLETDKKLRLEDRILLDKPLQAVKNSSKLIDNVRKLQRLMTQGIKTKPVDLQETFEELRALSFYKDHRDITIKIPGLPPYYMVEANSLLGDVFSNLITNAIKHSDDEKPLNIDIRVEPAIENGRKYYRCTVEDNGQGIPDVVKIKLFSRFQRGDIKAHGKGLGLSLVKTLVEGYGGSVSVEDRIPGDHTMGARFVIMLPAVET